MTEKLTIALMGAGGKMGCRITDNLKNRDYNMKYVEVSERGVQNLAQRGLAPTPQKEALRVADVVIMAIPDVLIERLSPGIAEDMKPGGILMALDPAAPCAGKMTMRKDCSYFAAHPCHPPVFNDETDPEARRDFFGGIKAKQDVVCALIQGPESAYAIGEQIAKEMYAPVMNSFRVTIDQMAILEPALSETSAATLVVAMKEAMDEAIKRGVPADAARAFLMGHINIELAIVFGEINAPFSDAAKKAIENAKSVIFKPDWKEQIFNPDNIKRSVDNITTPDK
ncbi:MAG: phosphogluconate dehydrogenase C-terminal domain-containing protein [Deltaproteobacteria bacterium]|nr:phosphogluconate dehydrogenase C-terminal domain-containing protein [Deltaproteobacteria bacterium]